MPKVRVRFRECIQDSQDLGSDEQHMVSRIWVSISADGGEEQEYIADLKQTVGADYETGTIEVGRPKFNADDYRGPWDQQAFATAAEEYFRSLLRSVIHLSPGAGIRMQDNRFIREHVVILDVPTTGGRAW